MNKVESYPEKGFYAAVKISFDVPLMESVYRFGDFAQNFMENQPSSIHQVKAG